MTKPNQTVQELVTRHGQEWKSLLYPFLVLRIISESKKASSFEIKDGINKLAGQKVEYTYTAYYRLMARLEHEAGLIEPVDLIKDKGPARVYYGLTEKGRELYEKLLKQVIYPVQKLLP
jgi:DNA-binding PadR family transcriptional regulator